MVKEYSLKTQGNESLSANFKVKEFACNDGSDKILIDSALIQVLQKIRDHFGKPITFNSAYRTPAYNIKVGGSPNSQHCKGTAVDAVIAGVDPLKVALYVQSLPEYTNKGGLGYYSRANLTQGFTHIDTRATKSRWISKTGTAYLSTTEIMPTIKKGDKDSVNGKSYAVTALQRHLEVSADGIFGAATEAKVKEIQRKNGLTVDGIVGPKTWNVL